MSRPIKPVDQGARVGKGRGARPAHGPSEGCDNKGRSTVADQGTPGEPFARRVAALRKALLDAITPADMEAITARLIQLAEEGNTQAIKLLFSYMPSRMLPALLFVPRPRSFSG